MSINWLVLSPSVQGLQFPTYGNYGGLNYSGGETIDSGETPDFTVEPVDALDALFKAHDQVYYQTTDPLTLAQADLVLIAGIAALDEDDLDAEGQLYAGLATLTMLHQILVTHGRPEVLAGQDVREITESALDQIEDGGVDPEPNEVMGLFAWVGSAASALRTVDNALILATAEEILDSVEEFEIEPEAVQDTFDLLVYQAQAAVEHAQDFHAGLDVFDALEAALSGNGAVSIAHATMPDALLI